MADKMKPGESTGAPQPNTVARDAAIQKWVKERYEKELKIAEATKLHVQDLKDDLSRLDKLIKADTKIALKYLKHEYKGYKLQEDAKRFMDDDEASDVLKDMKSVFHALSVGGQLDFVTAMENADNDDDAPSQPVLDKAFKAGRTAGENGEDGTTNPHDEGSATAKAWDDGWIEAQTEAANALGGDKAKKDEKAA